MNHLLVIVLILVSWLPSSLAEVELSRRDILIIRDMLNGGNGYGQKATRQVDSPWKYAASDLPFDIA